MPSRSTQRQKCHVKQVKKSRSFNLCRLIFAALPTIVFGVFTVVFSLQQDASARATREQNQAQEDEANRRIMFKEYIDDMTDLLLLNRGDNQTMEQTLRHIRVQTITILQNLDPYRKRNVIVFLYENQLLRSDILPNLSLRGADLNGLRFWSSSSAACRLPNLYLPGIYAENITFDHCSLVGAVFDRSSMSSAKFIGCPMLNVQFVNTNLTRAQFHGNYVYNADFSSSNLGHTSITGGTFRRVDLTNADLYQSDISDELLHPSKFESLGFHVVQNTRYPNGSFSDLGKENLAQYYAPIFEVCLVNNSLTQFHFYFQCPPNYHSSSRNSSKIVTNGDHTPVNSECYFLTEKDMTFLKVIEMRQFSLLIDAEQAAFNLSTFIRFNVSNNPIEFTLTIQFIQDDDVINEDESLTVTRKNNQLVNFETFNNTIPRLTRAFLVVLVCNTSRDIRQFCVLNDANLFIFERKFYFDKHQSTMKDWH